MIEIDGSLGEGGGQILRSSLALAAVLGKEVRVFNIRAGRSEPGLKAQHLAGARAVADLCNGSYRGLEMDSPEFVFRPGPIKGGDYRFDVGTAGSITLVLQALMPLLPFASREVSLEVLGGTDVKWSPPIDYLRMVTMPLLSRMGLEMTVHVTKRGHYPKGGGIVRINSTPSRGLRAMEGLRSGQINAIKGVSHAVKLPSHVAQRQARAAFDATVKRGYPPPEIAVESSPNNSNLSPGSGLVLSAMTDNSAILGGDCLGEKGRPAEEVGWVAVENLVQEVHGRGFLDRHMGDIVVPYLALAEGVSDLTISQITQHTLTNVRVSELVAGVRFGPVGSLGDPGRLRVKGIGVARRQGASSPRESRLTSDS